MMLGAPGVGKGTYSQMLVQRKGFIQISTGDLIRAAIKEGTEFGKKAKEIIDKGNLLPDELVIDLMRNKLESVSGNIILDGFPRTIKQAEALDKFAELELVINCVARKGVILDRLSGRRTCKKCGAIYHLTNIPPKVNGICDKCGSVLIQRDDEKPEVIKNRLKVYDKETFPLVSFYKKKGILKEVEASASAEEVYPSVAKAVESVK